MGIHQAIRLSARVLRQALRENYGVDEQALQRAVLVLVEEAVRQGHKICDMSTLAMFARLASGPYRLFPKRTDSFVARILLEVGPMSHEDLRTCGSMVGLWGRRRPMSRVLGPLVRRQAVIDSGGLYSLSDNIAEALVPPAALTLADRAKITTTSQAVTWYLSQRPMIVLGMLVAWSEYCEAAKEVGLSQWRARLAEALRRLASAGEAHQVFVGGMRCYAKGTGPHQTTRDKTGEVALPDRYHLPGGYVAINYQAVSSTGLIAERVETTKAEQLLRFPVALLLPSGAPVLCPITKQPYRFASLSDVRDDIATRQALREGTG